MPPGKAGWAENTPSVKAIGKTEYIAPAYAVDLGIQPSLPLAGNG